MLKKIIEPIRNERGTGLLLMLIVISALLIFFMIIAIEINLIYINQSIANTRADAIADSVAVYALRHDNTFSKLDLLRMTELLEAHNNPNNNNRIRVNAEISENRIIVRTEVEGRFITTRNTFTSYGTAIVEAVEPGTGLVFVPAR
jgi:competence protein ComGC